MTWSDDELDALLRSTLARRAEDVDFEPGRWVEDRSAARPTRAEVWRSRALLAGAGLAGAAAAAVIVIGALDAASTSPAPGPPTQAIPAPTSTRDTSITSSPTTARVPSASLTLDPGTPTGTGAPQPRPAPAVPAPSSSPQDLTATPPTSSSTSSGGSGPSSTRPPVVADPRTPDDPPVFRTSPPVDTPPTTWEPPPPTSDPAPSPSPTSTTVEDPVTPVVTVVASTGGSPVLCGPVHTCPELLATTQDLPTGVYTLRCTGWSTPAGTPLGEVTTTLGPEPTTTATGCYASTAIPQVEVAVLDDEGVVVATTGRVDW
ncbi:hypothetical protein L6241_06810 [Janibacter sp. Y6]